MIKKRIELCTVTKIKKCLFRECHDYRVLTLLTDLTVLVRLQQNVNFLDIAEGVTTSINP